MEEKEFLEGVGLALFLSFFFAYTHLFGMAEKDFFLLFSVGLLGLVFYYKSRLHRVGVGSFEVAVVVVAVAMFAMLKTPYLLPFSFMFLAPPLIYLFKERR